MAANMHCRSHADMALLAAACIAAVCVICSSSTAIAACMSVWRTTATRWSLRPAGAWPLPRASLCRLASYR